MSITEGLVPGTHPPIGTKMWQRNHGLGPRVQVMTVTRHTPTRFYCAYGERNSEYVFRVQNWDEIGGSRHYALGRIQPIDESDATYKTCVMEDDCQSLWSKLNTQFERRPKLTSENLERLQKIAEIAKDLEK